MSSDPRYGYLKVFEHLDFDQALARITETLKEQGFGVLSEIDVQAAMQAKLGADFRRYTILGACNPGLAYRALQGEPAIGLLLPCNVVVAEPEQGPGTMVAVISATEMFKLVGNDGVAPIAQEVDQRLRQALDAVA